MAKKSSHFKTAIKILSKIIVIISAIELLIMAILSSNPQQLEPVAEAILDSLLLSLFSTPLIYFWIIKPYVISCDRSEKQLHHIAHHDHLTELPNRRFLSLFLKKSLSLCKRYDMRGSILFIDLNDFKEINDTYGHDAGDEVLKSTAKQLNSVVRTEDLVSRMGGDEFVVAIHPVYNTEEEILTNARKIANKLQTALKMPIVFNEQQLHIKASIGIRTFSAGDTDSDAILKDADNAMYHAKHHQPADDICNNKTDISNHISK